MGVMVLLVLVCFSSVTFDRVAVQKAKEQAIGLDFLTHYVENIKGMPFASLQAAAGSPGVPINPLFGGTGAQNNDLPMNITIPAANTWVAVNTQDYLLFDPDLLWLQNRHPQMLVTLTSTLVDFAATGIEVNVKLDWDAPISRGGRLEVQVDMLRTKDL